MAKQEVPIKITVDTKGAQDDVEKLKKGVDDTGKSAKKAGEDAKKGSGGFASLGNAIKALGIVSVIAGVFGVLKDALFKNQKVADTFAAVTGTIASIMTQLIDIIGGVIDRVSKSTNGFDALGKVLSGILTLALTPFKLAFFGIKLVIEEIQLAWEDSFFGDKDQTKIKELTKSINETKDSLAETGNDAINAGKDIATNFIDAAKSIGDVVSGTIDGVKKIDIAATFQQQKAIVRLKNNAELAAATLAGLIEKYDRQAEQQRQIRDDETKSIDDRIKANEELGKILDQQRNAQLKQAQAILASAQAEANADKSNIQLQKAVIEAKNNVAGVEAQITGLLSEQKVNAVGLAKIKIELGKQEAQATNQRLLNEQKATAELIKNENDKLAAKKKIFEEESKIEIARLQGVVDSTNAGTEARIAAEIELANKKSELAIQGQQLDRQIIETGLNSELEQISKKRDNLQLNFDLQREYLSQEKAIIDEQFANKLITEQQYTDAIRANSDARQQIAEAEKNALIAASDAVANTLANASQVLGEETEAGKALAIASATISMITSAQKAYESMIGIPYVGPVLAPISAALAVAAGLKNIDEISKVKAPGMTGGGGVSRPSISTAAPMNPQLSTQVRATQVNTAAVNQLGNQATRAYVLNSDIQNAEQRNAYINRNASIGNP
jgi:hypothetical protein